MITSIRNNIYKRQKYNDMTTYQEYQELKGKQDNIVNNLSDKLNSYPKGEFGMVAESIRFSDEFLNLKKEFNKEFKKLQEINKVGVKLFKKEIRKAYEAKRIKK